MHTLNSHTHTRTHTHIYTHTRTCVYICAARTSPTWRFMALSLPFFYCTLFSCGIKDVGLDRSAHLNPRAQVPLGGMMAKVVRQSSRTRAVKKKGASLKDLGDIWGPLLTIQLWGYPVFTHTQMCFKDIPRRMGWFFWFSSVAQPLIADVPFGFTKIISDCILLLV